MWRNSRRETILRREQARRPTPTRSDASDCAVRLSVWHLRSLSPRPRQRISFVPGLGLRQTCSAPKIARGPSDETPSDRGFRPGTRTQCVAYGCFGDCRGGPFRRGRDQLSHGLFLLYTRSEHLVLPERDQLRFFSQFLCITVKSLLRQKHTSVAQRERPPCS